MGSTPSQDLQTSETENPELLEAEAFEHESLAAAKRARAKRIRVATAALLPASGNEPAQLTPSAYAKRCGLSIATVHRLRAAGMPTIPVNGRDYRIDASEADRWRIANAKHRSKRAKVEPADEAIDVSSALAGAGLKLVGGGR